VTAEKAPAAELPFMEPPGKPMPGWQLVKRGDALMSEGKHAEALAAYQQAMKEGNTRDNTAYSAACALALLGRKKEALEQLSRAAEWGFRDVKWMQQDEDLASLRAEKGFAALVARIPTLPPKDAAANAELRKLFEADQADRSPGPATMEGWKEVSARDEQRRARVKELIAEGALEEGADFLAAGFIFQHGRTPEDFAMAREMGAEAARRGNPGGLWLAAAAWDRWLMNAGRPQRFGTQYKSDGPAAKEMKLYTVDPSVTDEERARWGFPPLAEIPTTLR
jgi:tetratricopeptide (TPR) repeat protein